MPIRIVTALVALLATAAMTFAQTEQIQKKVEQKLDKAKKDQAALEDLLSQALKTNPDIRVAEAKLREAEAEVYRARMKVFHRIVLLQQEMKTARAQLNAHEEAYAQQTELYKKGLASKAMFDEFSAKLQQAKLDLARAEAEMDLLCGKSHKDASTNTTASALLWLAGSEFADGKWLAGEPLRIWDLALNKGAKPSDLAGPAPAAVPVSIADKLRKALDSTVKLDLQDVRAEGVIDVLRDYTKGVNVHSKITNPDAPGSLLLKEPVPLGAFYQWAEDHFDWRFIIRDYGVVATDRKSVPPGATLLMDFWRKRPEAAAP